MVKIISITGSEKGEMKLPAAFKALHRPDLILRAVLSAQAANRQSYGTDVMAGLRTSAHYHGVKGKRHSMKNKEIARGPRSHGTSPGQEFRMRRSPQTKGGRRAFPPRADRVFILKINKKEKQLALVSAIAATASEELVKARGHRIEGMKLPIIAEEKISEMKKAKEVKAFLKAAKLEIEMDRTAKRKIRAGRGKMRGRKYRTKKSVLFIVDNDNGIGKAAKNIPGMDVAKLNSLKIEMLAPGGQAGRLVIWSEGAIKKMSE